MLKLEVDSSQSIAPMVQVPRCQWYVVQYVALHSMRISSYMQVLDMLPGHTDQGIITTMLTPATLYWSRPSLK